MHAKILNLCLHDVVPNKSDVKTVYDTTFQQVEEIIKLLKKLRSQGIIDSYRIFFDDGYKSVLDVLHNINLGVSSNNIYMAIITDHIGRSNKLAKEDIILLSKQGFNICSHGVSHAALAIFLEDTLQPSPKNGDYHNMSYGKESVLSVQEIKFQFIESGNVIRAITGLQDLSFVLPYGLYNKDVVDQAVNTSYRRLYSCDSAFDYGQFLAPRLLVTQENIDGLDKLIKELPNRAKLLIK